MANYRVGVREVKTSWYEVKGRRPIKEEELLDAAKKIDPLYVATKDVEPVLLAQAGRVDGKNKWVKCSPHGPVDGVDGWWKHVPKDSICESAERLEKIEKQIAKIKTCSENAKQVLIDYYHTMLIMDDLKECGLVDGGTDEDLSMVRMTYGYLRGIGLKPDMSEARTRQMVDLLKRKE